MSNPVDSNIILKRQTLTADTLTLSTFVLAAQYIHRFDVVTSMGLIADSGTAGDEKILLGVAVSDIAIGQPIEVVAQGEISNSAWTWTQGDPIYLNGTVLSNVAPGGGDFVRQVGVASSKTTVFVSVGETTPAGGPTSLLSLGVRADVNIPISAAGTVVAFSTPVGGIDYVVQVARCVKFDDDTITEAVTISAKTVNGFTATPWPDNAILDYVVVPKT
jgi:phosphotransferase system HPr-like phosphotransfer protein